MMIIYKASLWAQAEPYTKCLFHCLGRLYSSNELRLPDSDRGSYQTSKSGQPQDFQDSASAYCIRLYRSPNIQRWKTRFRKKTRSKPLRLRRTIPDPTVFPVPRFLSQSGLIHSCMVWAFQSPLYRIFQWCPMPHDHSMFLNSGRISTLIASLGTRWLEGSTSQLSNKCRTPGGNYDYLPFHKLWASGRDALNHPPSPTCQFLGRTYLTQTTSWLRKQADGAIAQKPRYSRSSDEVYWKYLEPTHQFQIKCVGGEGASDGGDGVRRRKSWS